MKQDQINELLVQLALEGNKVVRLKGGDSFVFGRGSEEILALKEKEIPWELVPGITSCVSVPELAGIPVTHRNVSRSFHVITGHTLKGVQSEAELAYMVPVRELWSFLWDFPIWSILQKVL